MEGPKIDLAKAAATGTVANLRPMDQVGVLAFDNSFAWVVPRCKLRRSHVYQRSHRRHLRQWRNTDRACPGPKPTTCILPIEAPYRHILLLTDGISEEGNSYELARTALTRRSGISTSTPWRGRASRASGKDRVELAGGKAYFCASLPASNNCSCAMMEHTGSTAVETALTGVAKETEIPGTVSTSTTAPALKGCRPLMKPSLRGNHPAGRSPGSITRALAIRSRPRSGIYFGRQNALGHRLGYLERLRQILYQPHARSFAACARREAHEYTIVQAARSTSCIVSVPVLKNPLMFRRFSPSEPMASKSPSMLKKSQAALTADVCRSAHAKACSAFAPWKIPARFRRSVYIVPKPSSPSTARIPAFKNKLAEYTGGRFELSAKDVSLIRGIDR